MSSWSNTLHLPKSALANRSNLKLIKSNLPRVTSEIFKWQNSQLDRECRTLHDGPPYANGDLHVGHALNKILKDILNRHNVSCGFRVPYTPGWDCHGLPIEHAALKRKKAKTMLGKRKLAKELALEMVENQKLGFLGFGVMADFDNIIYKTLTKDYVFRELKVFLELLKKKLIFRQRKPVYWSVESGTALAESELEYGVKTDLAVYLKYKVSSLPPSLANLGECYLAVWTTTPWTLVANQGIAVNKNLEYIAVDFKGSSLIIAKNLKNELENLWGVPLPIKQRVDVNDLLEIKYECKLRKQIFKVILGDHVTDTSGTGLVHTAPGHGKEDFIAGQLANLPIVSPVDGRGRYTSEVNVDALKSLNARVEGTPKIVEMLGDDIIHKHSVTHSVPLDWRTKTPVMVRATPQFFIDLGHDVREMALKAIDNVEFRPKGGEHRLRAFVQSRSDWCISRQRAWGVPIPVLYHTESDLPILDEDVVNYTINKIGEYGPDAWFEEEEDCSRWLPFDGSKYRKGTDTLDVWLDSGSSWTMLDGQADYYLEGSDQHRGWFQSSLLTKVAVTGSPVAPFKKLITHGFVLDGNRQKMSKSLGNVIDPKKLVSQLGIDGLRLLMAQSDYTSDITLNDTNTSQVASMVKKFRLTFKYLLGNVGDLQVNNQVELSSLDKFTLVKLKELVNQCKVSYDSQNFQNVVKLVQSHMSTELSAIYFDAAKDVLYADKENSNERLAIQYTLHEILDAYVRLMAPIMPLLTQEVWDLCPNTIKRGLDNPLMAGYPSVVDLHSTNEDVNKVEEHLKVRDAVNEAIASARDAKLLGSSLACDVYIESKLDLDPKLLEQLCIASNVFLGSAPTDAEWVHTSSREKYTVYAVNPKNHKCPRCWKYTSLQKETLCVRCEDAIN